MAGDKRSVGLTVLSNGELLGNLNVLTSRPLAYCIRKFGECVRCYGSCARVLPVVLGA